MAATPSKKLGRFDLMEVRSLFRSLFQEEWEQIYPTWQEAISKGSLEWSFNASDFRDTATELDELLTYPDAVIGKWLPKICTGLPHGSPDPALSTREFITQVQALITDMAKDWEANGKPRRL